MSTAERPPNRKLHADHLIPRYRGGPESGDNLVWACRSCNSSKGSKDLLEWFADKRDFPPLPLMRRYLKLAIVEAEAKAIMDIRLVDWPSVTFLIDFVPTRYPTSAEPVTIASHRARRMSHPTT